MGANKAGERVVEKWLYDALAGDSLSVIASCPQTALSHLGKETEANRGVPDDPRCRRGWRESVQTAATGLPCRGQREEPTAHSAASPALPLACCLRLAAPRPFSACVRVFPPRHTPLFTRDSLPPCTVGGHCEAAGPPAQPCGVKVGSSLPRQPQQRRPRKDTEALVFWVLRPKPSPSAGKQGSGLGRPGPSAHSHGWAATEVLLRSAILCLP